MALVCQMVYLDSIPLVVPSDIQFPLYSKAIPLIQLNMTDLCKVLKHPNLLYQKQKIQPQVPNY